MNKCIRCKDPLPLDGDFISCSNCNGNMHFECSSVSQNSYRKMSLQAKKNWTCTSCRLKDKAPPVDNIQMAKRSRPAESPKANSTSDVQPDNSLINNELKEIKALLKDYAKAVEFTTTKYDEISISLSKNNTLLQTLMKEIEEYKKQIETKDAQITCLQTQVNALEQKQIDKNVEIKNVPMSNTENAFDIIKALGETLNTEIIEGDIEEIYSYTDRKNKQMKNNVVSFTKKPTKVAFLERAKQKRTLKYGEMCTKLRKEDNPIYSNQNIYINEQLTAHFKKLLWLAKTKARATNWKYVWFRRNKVLARKSEGDRIIEIQTINDIERMA